MDSSESVIKWDHIRLLYEKDREHAGPGQALICPKLSFNHVNLNNSLKMRVRLATQVSFFVIKKNTAMPVFHRIHKIDKYYIYVGLQQFGRRRTSVLPEICPRIGWV